VSGEGLGGLSPQTLDHGQYFALISYCLNCTKFGKLILRKIIKTVATRCHILKRKCTEFDFGWGSAADPAEELTAFPEPPSWI